MNESTVTITVDSAEVLIAFIRNHEREDIPDDVWEVCQSMMEELEVL